MASFLEGMDDRIVHRDLKQIPEVANHVAARVSLRIHSIRNWLCTSAIACALGLTLVAAGYRGWLFSNMQYSYYSPGVVLAGEPEGIFDILRAGATSREEQRALVAGLEKRRQEQFQLFDDYRGQGFTERMPGGLRVYRESQRIFTERPQNRWLMFSALC